MYILYNKSGDGSGSQFLCYKKNLCHSKTNVYEREERNSETRKQFRDSLEHISDRGRKDVSGNNVQAQKIRAMFW